ncbi:MAG: arabinofuranosyltransferase [Actinomycetota bacterium]|nr:arabinofuranosyltransferase [Actinomycetota bacterium]
MATTVVAPQVTRVSRDRGPIVTALVMAGLIAAAAASLAWVGDDALITLRTALNAAHGWGWGFNATEAVQGYTHPLWFGLWLLAGSATGNWLGTAMVMGVVATAAAVLLALAPGRSGPRIVLIGGLLLLSNAFVEYATSGLENPLGYLLFAALIAVSSADRRAVAAAALTGLLVAALVLTRMDYVLLFLPAAALWTWQRRDNVRALVAAAGAALLPVGLWFGWAYVTYGYVLPATYEAKTNLAIPRGQLIETGWYYLSFSLRHDPATVVMLAVGAVLLLRWGTAMQRSWLVGIALYLAYVVWIGGDFMIGRFVAVPVLICAALCARVDLPDRIGRVIDGPPVAGTGSRALAYLTAVVAVMAVAIVGVLLGSPATTLARPTTQRWEPMEIVLSDERGVYAVKYGGVGDYLRNLGKARASDGAAGQSVFADDSREPLELINTPLWQIERAADQWPDNPGPAALPERVVSACGGLGVIAVMNGPRVHVVDECALTDRFLAALPGGDPDMVALPGHMRRQVPEGYLDAVRRGDAGLVLDPAQSARLTAVWDRIRSQIPVS